MRPHRTVAVLSLISVLALISLDATEADEDGKEADPWNFATISLYNILSLEGHRVSLAQLRGELGPPGEGGHSMRQIRDVAKRHGLVLDARVLPKQAAAIDRPILLFVRKGEEGHFTVVRPVGHTGKLIQSLDRDGPTVFDADVLLNSPSWTGVARFREGSNCLASSCWEWSFWASLRASFCTSGRGDRDQSRLECETEEAIATCASALWRADTRTTTRR